MNDCAANSIRAANDFTKLWRRCNRFTSEETKFQPNLHTKYYNFVMPRTCIIYYTLYTFVTSLLFLYVQINIIISLLFIMWDFIIILLFCIILLFISTWHMTTHIWHNNIFKKNCVRCTYFKCLDLKLFARAYLL